MASIFFILVLLTLILFFLAFGQLKPVLIFTIWTFAVSLGAIVGLYVKFPFLLSIGILVTAVLSILIFRRIRTLKFDLRLLLSIHLIRIPIEVILYQLYLNHSVPIEMTFKGWNIDLFFGISSLVFLIIGSRNKKVFDSSLFKIWNILGIISLIEIVVIGVLSSPVPIQQIAFGRSNIAVLDFPYCLLPTVIVPIILLSHFMFLFSPKKIRATFMRVV